MNHLGVKPLRRPTSFAHYLFATQARYSQRRAKVVIGGVGSDLGNQVHMLHGAGIFTNIYLNNGPNVGKYSSTMEHGELVQAHTS